MTDFSLVAVALVILSYLLGSISSAIIVCKLLGLPDPRSEGSRNPGATNVLRIGGKKAAAITLAGDWLKGLLAVLAGHLLDQPPLVLGLAGLAAFLGHLYPVFFGFKGGKGVATAFGVLYGLSLLIGLSVTAVWLAIAFLFRYSSLAGLVAMALAPAVIWLFWPATALVLIQCVITLILYYRHRENISNLLNGKESKIGRRDRS